MLGIECIQPENVTLSENRILVKWSFIPQNVHWWDRLDIELGVCQEHRATQKYPYRCCFYLRVTVHAALTLKKGLSCLEGTLLGPSNTHGGQWLSPHYLEWYKETASALEWIISLFDYDCLAAMDFLQAFLDLQSTWFNVKFSKY